MTAVFLLLSLLRFGSFASITARIVFDASRNRSLASSFWVWPICAPCPVGLNAVLLRAMTGDRKTKDERFIRSKNNTAPHISSMAVHFTWMRRRCLSADTWRWRAKWTGFVLWSFKSPRETCTPGGHMLFHRHLILSMLLCVCDVSRCVFLNIVFCFGLVRFSLL